MKTTTFIWILYFLPLWTTCALPVSAEEIAETPQSLEFNLFYPVTKYSGTNIRHKQKIYMGVGVSYEWFFWNRIGLLLEPFFWYKPVYIFGAPTNLMNGGVNAGVITRPLPDSFFDPRLSGYSGYTVMKGGNLHSWSVFPVASQASVNVFRITGRFTDNDLALSLTGTLGRYFHQISSVKPFYFDFGLGLRGSF